MGPSALRAVQADEGRRGWSTTTGVDMGSQRRSCSTKLTKEPSAPQMITCPLKLPSGPAAYEHTQLAMLRSTRQEKCESKDRQALQGAIKPLQFH